MSNGIFDLKNTKFSVTRPIGSYVKVQKWFSPIIRNKNMQLNKLENNDKNILNVGCGENLMPDFINLDYEWRPKFDLCWDIIKGIPIE